jgi:hypothetical protein
MKPILFFIALLLSVSSFAQVGRGSLQDERQQIRRGFISGQLTAPEMLRLNQQARCIQAKTQAFRTNDGRISMRERAILRRDHRRLDRQIALQRFDRQRRF